MIQSTWKATREFFTHSRWVSFVGWLGTVWAALEAQGGLHWPLTQTEVVTIIGVTIAWLGRSGLADRKVKPEEPQP